MEDSISLSEIVSILRKHFFLILMTSLTGSLIAAGMTFFIVTPQYNARAQLIVSLPESETTSVNDIDFNLQMLSTYKDIILRGDAQALEVQKRLTDDYQIRMTDKEIKEALKVVQTPESQLFSIEALNGDANKAAMIANVTAEVFKETVKGIVPNVETVTIVSRAIKSTDPVSPNHFLNLIIGLFTGVSIGIVSTYIIELLDRTVKGQKYVTKSLELTILVALSSMSDKEINRMLANEEWLNQEREQGNQSDPRIHSDV